jgi:hypothetical protein
VESVFGDDSEPVCGNGSGMSGSLIKLLSFFGKQIQQGSLETPEWSLVIEGNNGIRGRVGRRPPSGRSSR